MAISQVGFGLKPINKLGSNYNAAQISEYRQVGRPDYQMVFQAPVMVQRFKGNVVRPAYSTGQQFDGSFVGAQYDDATGKPVFTDHYTSGDLAHIPFTYQAGFNDGLTQFVTDDPYQLYLMKIDGNLTLSNMNGNFRLNYRATDATNGISSDGKRSIVKIDSSTKSFVSNLPIQYITFGTGEDDIQTSKDNGYNIEDAILDAGSNVVVRLNQAKYVQNTGLRGII
jgi:hypothetical protein